MLAIVSAVTFTTVDGVELGCLQKMAESIWRICYRDLLAAEQIEYMLNLMYSPTALADDLTLGVVYEWIYSKDKRVGYLAFEISVVGRCVRLNKLYLLPDEQGRGLGQAALMHMVDRATALGLDAVELNVNKQNQRAIRAYERAGFKAVASIVKDIGGGFVMDDFVMRKGCGKRFVGGPGSDHPQSQSRSTAADEPSRSHPSSCA